MAGSSATIPIAVAVIGVMGAIIPIYVNNVVISNSNYPNVGVGLHQEEYSGARLYNIDILNNGNAPATNLTLSLSDSPVNPPSNILSVKNVISTTDIILPKYNNTILEPGQIKIINSPFLEIQIPKLIQGPGSIVRLDSVINGSGTGYYHPEIYIVYDQGSIRTGGAITTSEYFNDFSRIYQGYIIVFYVVLFGLLYLYIRRRRSVKRFLTEVAKNIMEIRAVLRNDGTNKSIISEVWFQKSEKKRQDIQYVGDYLLIDDFYSELRRRNSYLRDSTIDEAKAIDLNKTCLEVAEKTLKDIDWNKYR